MTNHSGPGPRTVTAAAMAVAMVAVPAVPTAAVMGSVISVTATAMDLAMTKAMATDANQAITALSKISNKDVDVEVVAEENSLLDIEIAEPEEEE